MAKSQSSTSAAGASGDRLRLRHTFVGMLFALTAGQIAISAADVVGIVKTAGWERELLAPIAHLFLALVIVTTSWVGWSATAARATHPVRHMFHLPYIVLLIDVLLVVIFLTIARGVELDEAFRRRASTAGSFVGVTQVGTLSGNYEAFWVLMMFVFFLLWDVVHDVRMNEETLASIFASVVALAAAAVVWLLSWVWSEHNGLLSVVSTDVALLAIVVGFRALKPAEEVLAKRRGNESDEEKTRAKDRRFPWKWWVLTSVIVAILGLVGMYFGTQAS